MRAATGNWQAATGGRGGKAYGYSEPAPLGSVFALAEPDASPLERPTRVACFWDGPAWTEVDPATGEVIACGVEARPAAGCLEGSRGQQRGSRP